MVAKYFYKVDMVANIFAYSRYGCKIILQSRYGCKIFLHIVDMVAK